MEDEALAAVPSRQRRRFAKPLALLPDCSIEQAGTWLDLGCGDGVFSLVLAHLLGRDGHLIGLDRDRSALKRFAAHMRQWRAPAACQALLANFRMPLPLRGLHGVLAANSLHFVPDAGKDAVLRQVSFALRPGGRIVIVEYNATRGTGAVPYPETAEDWVRRLRRLDFDEAEAAASTPSSYLGQMVAVQARVGFG